MAEEDKKKDKSVDTPTPKSQDLPIHLLHLPPMLPRVDLWGKPEAKVPLPFITKEESSKYLGVYLHLELHWEVPRGATQAKVRTPTYLVSPPCLAGSPAVHILPQVRSPAILQGAGCIPRDTKTLRRWARLIAKAVQRK